MEKKTFKDNPALRFIGTARREAEEREEAEELEQTAEAGPAKPPKGYKLNPLYIETKSKRLQLVIQPSLYERVKAKAHAKGLSVNEYCHRALDEATKCD